MEIIGYIISYIFVGIIGYIIGRKVGFDIIKDKYGDHFPKYF